MLLFFAGGLVGVHKHLFQRVFFITSMNLPLNRIFQRKTFSRSREGCIQGLTLVELCSHIGREIEKSDTFSDRVCHACGRKMRNAFDFYTFIASNLKRETDKSAVMKVDDHSGRFKRPLPTTISSPDRSPQARKGKKATGQKSSAKKSVSFKDVSSSVVNTDSDHNELSTLNTADDLPQ